jgi:hypothetical protein
VHRRASGHLDGFQIEPARLLQIAKDEGQQLVYFLGNFFVDRGGRFFSCAIGSCSTGRNWQIFSLSSSSRWLS